MKLLHEQVSPETLGVVRVWVFGLWLLKLIADPLPRLADLPRLHYLPPGVLLLIPHQLWDSLLSPSFLWGVKLLLILALGLAVVGVRTRAAMIAVALGLVFQQGFVRAFGHINHTELPLLYAAIILACFPAGDAVALRPTHAVNRKPETYAAALVFLLLMLCLTYTLPAAHRLVYGGLPLFQSESLRYWFVQNSYATTYLDWGYGQALAEDQTLTNWLLWLFPLVTIVELLAPLCLVSGWFRLLFAALMIPFHVLSAVSMNVLFWESLALLVLLLDLERMFGPRPGRDQPPIVFFDGVCGLCNASVDFLMSIDRAHVLRFTPLQGETAAELLSAPDEDSGTWSMILVDERGQHDRSTAALRTVSRVGGLWNLALLALVVPRALRDAVYRFIARNRYRWFGEKEACRIPTPEERAVFLP